MRTTSEPCVAWAGQQRKRFDKGKLMGSNSVIKTYSRLTEVYDDTPYTLHQFQVSAR